MARTPFKEDIFSKLLSQELKYKFVTEFYFHPKRRWRFDYACPELKIALEVEGGVWTGGRHTRGLGFLKDMEKYNTATTMGWRILRCTPSNKSESIDLIKELITHLEK